MLYKRMITGCIALMVALYCIFFSSHPVFLVLSGLVLMWCGWEWAHLTGWNTWYWRVLYVIGLCALGILSFLYESQYLSVFITIQLLIWVWILCAMVCYSFTGRALGFQYASLRALIGYPILCNFWTMLNHLHVLGYVLLLFFLGTIWISDIGAYFIGYYLGRKKIASRISPNKTWEGAVGGLLCVWLSWGLALFLWDVHWRSIPWIFLSTGLLVAYGILGDLFESFLKRQSGFKDSGHCLPGHGGILDRLDSTLAAASGIYAVLMLCVWCAQW